jgi:hypothetical protein
MTDSPVANLVEAFEELQSKNLQLETRLEESLAKKILALEDIGWDPIWGKKSEGRGLVLDDLHNITPHLRDMAAVNPLHIRGAQLRHAYVFGRGIEFSGLSARTQTAVDNLYNQAALFSVQAHETNNLEKFAAGNFFVIRDESTQVCTVVPVEEIRGEVTDPDDNSKVRYFLRRWDSVDASGRGLVKERWYPVARYKKSVVGRGKRGKGIQKTIRTNGKPIPVDQAAVMYHETTKRQAGWTYGVPDSLGAAVWSVSYSEYLKDNSALVKALQQIAWAITSSTKSGANSAAAAVRTPGVGGTASMGSGNTLSSVGVPSAQVNFNNGQPLAAMVATSLGVPVIALLSSPGATGGSYGAATTLDTPTIKGMKAVQDSWKLFYKEILADMGSPDAEVTFPNINQDEAYREVQSIGIAYADGRLFQDEAREATLQVLDVKKMHNDLPKPDEFNAGSDPADDSNPEASQGNTGAVPGGVDQDETNHDND